MAWRLPKVCRLAALGAALLLPDLVRAQLHEPALIVNGTPLLTTRPVIRIGDEWFLPLAAVARSLGIQLEVRQGPILVAHRLDGADVTYDGRTGEIRYGFLMLAQVKQFQQIQMDRLADDLLFPMGAAVALLGLDIREDAEHNALVIRVVSDTGMQTPSRNGSLFHLAALDYTYGLNTNLKTYGQFASIRSEFLVGGVRTRSSLLMSRIPQGSFLGVTQGTLRADISADRTVIVGDQAVYSGLEALASSVRGLGYETKFKRFGSYAYAGRAAGATHGDFRSLLGLGETRYDSNVAGVNLNRPWESSELSVAGVHFDGRDRRGTSLGMAYRQTRGKNQVSVQGVAGWFTAPVDGAGHGFVLADTFSPAQQFSFTGRIERYSRNFLAPREDSHFDPQLTKSAAATVRPSRYITINGSVTDRGSLSGPQRTRSYSYGTSTVSPGRYPLQFGFFRSIQLDSSSAMGRFRLDQYFLTLPQFERYSVYSHYSRAHVPGEIVETLNTTVSVDTGRRGRFGAHDQLQFKKMRRYGADWTLQPGTSDGFFRAGLDRVLAGRDRVLAEDRQSGFSPVVSLRLPLPGGRSFELTYVGEKDSHTLQFQFAGSARRNRAVMRDSMGVPGVVIATPLHGRVYLDSDLDGSFQSASDQPIAGVPVRLGNESVTTDDQGFFRFEQVSPGAYTVKAELAGLPADLVFADIPERTIAVVPYRENPVNFRVTRAGRVSGIVTYMDYASDPEKPAERPLPDVRIVGNGDRDTFSESNGSFLLGDIIPGSYELKLDPATLPEHYLPTPEFIRVHVGPGETVQNIRFHLAVPPRSVIERRVPER